MGETDETAAARTTAWRPPLVRAWFRRARPRIETVARTRRFADRVLARALGVVAPAAPRGGPRWEPVAGMPAALSGRTIDAADDRVSLFDRSLLANLSRPDDAPRPLPRPPEPDRVPPPPRPSVAPPAPSLGQPQVLGHAARAFLGRLLSREQPRADVYTTPEADRLARAAGADAVTFGEAVAFRAGRFRPHTAAGLALVGHELVHVAQPPARADDPPARRAADERPALAAEWRVLRELGAPAPADSPNGLPAAVVPAPAAPAVAVAVAAAPVTQVAVVRTAAADWPVPPGPAPAPVVPPEQWRAVKEEVFRELRERLRSEFERGG